MKLHLVSLIAFSMLAATGCDKKSKSEEKGVAEQVEDKKPSESKDLKSKKESEKKSAKHTKKKKPKAGGYEDEESSFSELGLLLEGESELYASNDIMEIQDLSAAYCMIDYLTAAHDAVVSTATKTSLTIVVEVDHECTDPADIEMDTEEVTSKVVGSWTHTLNCPKGDLSSYDGLPIWEIGNFTSIECGEEGSTKSELSIVWTDTYPASNYVSKDQESWLKECTGDLNKTCSGKMEGNIEETFEGESTISSGSFEYSFSGKRKTRDDTFYSSGDGEFKVSSDGMDIYSGSIQFVGAEKRSPWTAKDLTTNEDLKGKLGDWFEIGEP